MLTPVLIYTDDAKISTVKSQVTTAAAYVQELYNQFAEVDIFIALADVQTIIFNAKNNGNDFEAYCKSEFIKQPQFDTLKTLGLSAQKMDSLIEYPDFSPVKKWILLNPIADHPISHLIQVEYLQIVDGVVSVLDTAFNDIDALYTYYTQNDRGAEVAAKILAYLTLYNSQVTDIVTYFGQPAITDYNHYYPFKLKDTDIAENNLKSYYDFIRAQEAAYPDYVAA